jgi:endonuclease III
MVTLKRIVERLKSAYGASVPPRSVDPFAIVLYENIAYLVPDERRAKAFVTLQHRIGITPQAVARAPIVALRAVAAEGGVYPELRADRMREAARIVLEEFDGDIGDVLKAPAARRRRMLKKFPSIGDPGVDKILLLSRTEPSLALDSNGLRVLLRLGFGTEAKSYAQTYASVRRALGEFHERDFDLLIDAHYLLLRHGRELCKRTAPLCEPCPLKASCAFYRRSR